MADNNSFKVGDTVYVPALKKNAVIVAQLKNDNVRVSVGAFQTTLNRKDLRAAKTAKGVNVRHPFEQTPKRMNKHTARQGSHLDLHGYTQERASEALDFFLSDALVAGFDWVDIIHGVGEGILRNLVHTRLSQISAVKHFHTLPGNAGTTRVFLS